MRRRPRLAALVAIALVLLAGPLAVASGATAAASPANATAEDSPRYSLEDLRRGGTQPSGAPPSFRWTSSGGVYLDYEESNPLRRSDGPEYQAQQLIEPGAVVDRNTIRVHRQAGQGAGEASLTLRIVYWDAGTREVARNGTTVTERVAANVTTTTKTVTFEGPFDVAEVDLRPHYDDATQVTMWVVGQEGSARWRFVHHSSETSRAVATDTAGGRLWWLITSFVSWVVFGGFVMLGGLFAAKRRASTPKKGWLWWGFVLVIVGFGLLAFMYDSLAELFIDGPQILALATLAMLGIPILESRGNLEKMLFVRPIVTDATNAAGEDAQDAVMVELDSRDVKQMPDGTLAIVESGLVKWFARLLGGASVITGSRQLKTRCEADGTSYDQVVWVDPDADEALDYQPEGFDFELPTTMRGLLPVGVLALVLATLGQGLMGAPWIGALALPALALRPRRAESKVEPATGHERAAHITMMVGARDFADAETLEEARAQLVSERAKSQRDVEEQLDAQDSTLVSEALTDGDVSIKIDDTEDREESGLEDKAEDGPTEPDDDDGWFPVKFS